MNVGFQRQWWKLWRGWGCVGVVGGWWVVFTCGTEQMENLLGIVMDMLGLWGRCGDFIGMWRHM